MDDYNGIGYKCQYLGKNGMILYISSALKDKILSYSAERNKKYGVLLLIAFLNACHIRADDLENFPEDEFALYLGNFLERREIVIVYSDIINTKLKSFADYHHINISEYIMTHLINILGLTTENDRVSVTIDGKQ